MLSENKVTNNSTLKLKVIIGYAMGELGFTFFLMYIAYYLMYFLTNVLAFSTTTAAIIFTLCQWFEAISVLISGVIINRSKISYRRWMIAGALICWIFTTLLFMKYSMSMDIYVYLFAFLYFVSYWGFNIMWISYRSLLGTISRVPHDTVVLSTTGAQFGTIAAIIFSVFGIKILTVYAHDYMIYGISAFVYCGIMVIGMIFVYLIAKPYDRIDSIEYSNNPVKKEKITLKQLLNSLKGPMIPFFLSVSLKSSVNVMIGALLIYYLRYVIGDISVMSIYVTLISIAALLGAISAERIVKYVDKRQLYIITSFISCALLLSINFVGSTTIGFLIIMSLNSYFMFLGNVLIPVFFNDISEYNLYKTKIDSKPFIFSMGALSIRMSQIIGSGIAAFGLVIFQYDPSGTMSQITINGIKYLLSYVASAIIILGTIAFWFYKLDNKTMSIVQNNKNKGNDDE